MGRRAAAAATAPRHLVLLVAALTAFCTALPQTVMAIDLSRLYGHLSAKRNGESDSSLHPPPHQLQAARQWPPPPPSTKATSTPRNKGARAPPPPYGNDHHLLNKLHLTAQRPDYTSTQLQIQANATRTYIAHAPNVFFCTFSPLF
ncbi:Uncharacterized protein GBIM_22263 [Gryllus bimaculatus]|nr:Uncharacterized protein GBIM_22263 [Gryllus bimaculatus]